jgi:hypothetical protein
MRRIRSALRVRRERPRNRLAAEQRDEIAALQLIELHAVPCQPGPDCRISCAGGGSHSRRQLLANAAIAARDYPREPSSPLSDRPSVHLLGGGIS